LRSSGSKVDKWRADRREKKLDKREDRRSERQKNFSEKHAGLGKDWSMERKQRFYDENTGKGAGEEQRAMANIVMGRVVSDKDEFAKLMTSDPKFATKLLSETKARHKASGNDAELEKIDKMLETRPDWKVIPSKLQSELEGMNTRELNNIDASAWDNAGFRDVAIASGQFRDVVSSDPYKRREARRGMSAKQIKAVERYLVDDGASDDDKAVVAARNTRSTQEQTRYDTERHRLADVDMDVEENVDAEKHNESFRNLVNADIIGKVKGYVKDCNLKLQDIDMDSVDGLDEDNRASFDAALTTLLSEDDGLVVIEELKSAVQNSTGSEQARAREMLEHIENQVLAMELDDNRPNPSTNVKIAIKPANASPDGADIEFDYDTEQFNGDDGPARAKNREDFGARIAKNLSLLNVIQGVDDGGELSRGVVDSISVDDMGVLMDKAYSAEGTAREDVEYSALEKLGSVLNAYNNSIKGDASVSSVRKNEAAEKLRVFDMRVKELLRAVGRGNE